MTNHQKCCTFCHQVRPLYFYSMTTSLKIFESVPKCLLCVKCGKANNFVKRGDYVRRFAKQIIALYDKHLKQLQRAIMVWAKDYGFRYPELEKEYREYSESKSKFLTELAIYSRGKKS